MFASHRKIRMTYGWDDEIFWGRSFSRFLWKMFDFPFSLGVRQQVLSNGESKASICDPEEYSCPFTVPRQVDWRAAVYFRSWRGTVCQVHLSTPSLSTHAEVSQTQADHPFFLRENINSGSNFNNKNYDRRSELDAGKVSIFENCKNPPRTPDHFARKMAGSEKACDAAATFEPN
jgi:hypothetical protein